MQLQYFLQGVTLDQQDLEKLWVTILVPMFDSMDQSVIMEKRADVTITTGTGTKREIIQDYDMKRLLEGVFVRGIVTTIDIHFELTTLEPDDTYTRGLIISLSNRDPTAVQLEGEDEWIHQARDKIDSFLGQRTNSSTKYRRPVLLSIAISLAAIIGIPFYKYLEVTSNFPFPITMLVGAVLGLAFGGLAVIALSPFYPISIFKISARTRPPWYYRLGREIIVGVAVTLIASAIISVLLLIKLWPF